jgi:hypothetical protein
LSLFKIGSKKKAHSHIFRQGVFGVLLNIFPVNFESLNQWVWGCGWKYLLRGPVSVSAEAVEKANPLDHFIPDFFP